MTRSPLQHTISAVLVALLAAGGALAKPTFTVTIAEAGVFNRHEDVPVINAIHYGVDEEAKEGWEPMGDVPVIYDSAGRSEPVVVEIPASLSVGHYLGFVLLNSSGRMARSSMDMFIDLEDPVGTMVHLPIENAAGYPFAAECYDIDVEDVNVDGGFISYRGRVKKVMVGFTAATLDEYLENNNVQWEDITGASRLAGTLKPAHLHDGGYKGTYHMDRMWMWVPRGKNLVFKPVIERFAGVCHYGDDTRLVETTETKTYFHEVP